MRPKLLFKPAIQGGLALVAKGKAAGFEQAGEK
jgi:hypothetical protein